MVPVSEFRHELADSVERRLLLIQNPRRRARPGARAAEQMVRLFAESTAIGLVPVGRRQVFPEVTLSLIHI